MPFKLEKTKFTPHPEGRCTGVIKEVEDLGVVETQFGNKLKLVVKIVCDKHSTEEGEPMLVAKRFNQSASRRSALTEFREIIADRRLEDIELENFDEEAELIGKKVGFQIKHNVTDEATYANIANIWPLDETEKEVVETNKAKIYKPSDATDVADDDDLPF